MRRNYEEKLSVEIIRRNYQEKLLHEIIRRNYYTKLSGEIMTRNYELVYYVAQNVEIIGILAYPKSVRYTEMVKYLSYFV